MIAAKEIGQWLTLTELHELTGYGEASISAELRNLRKDGFIICKRIRSKYGTGLLWEYWIGADFSLK
jgi:hypothetical protein